MSFEGAWLKIERAKHHINDLNREVGRYFSHSFSISVEDDPNTGQRSVTKKAHKPMPVEFGLIIGDAIHNMRSALDLMTWEALLPYKPKEKAVQFPVGSRRFDFFKHALSQRQINCASEKVVRAFRELKVYPGGNDNLWRLHWVDVSDKHKVIIPVPSAIVSMRFFISDFDPGFYGPRVVFQEHSVIQVNVASDKFWTWYSSAPLKDARRGFKKYKKFYSFTIAFGSEPQIVAGKLVIPVLKSFLESVEAAIERVEKAVRNS